MMKCHGDCGASGYTCVLLHLSICHSAVIERTRDVKDVIRREAFLWLANKCSIKNLTIKQRIQVCKLETQLSCHHSLEYSILYCFVLLLFFLLLFSAPQ